MMAPVIIPLFLFEPAGGTLVLGQEQDNEGGDFDLRQAYVGSLYALNVWDSLLSENDVSKMSSSCQQWWGTLKAWPDFQTGLHGGVLRKGSIFCRGKHAGDDDDNENS